MINYRTEVEITSPNLKEQMFSTVNSEILTNYTFQIHIGLLRIGILCTKIDLNWQNMFISSLQV